MSTSVTTMYEWNEVDWSKLERSTFKLQKRIYQAARHNDVKAVHKLQKLLMKSTGAALLAVRRVTQDNRGKGTAGIDGQASLNDRQKIALFQEIKRAPMVSKCKPVRRVWIPKPGKNEQRPLGIPVMEDRARQALAKMALEPEWEAKFEPNSYGFRPGRSCQDAITAIWLCIKQAPKYVLDADIAKCFDRINHEALLNKLGTFPEMRRAVKAWLKAGIMDGGDLFPTSEGTPQGGVISPLLANIALHGLATAIESAFQKHKVVSTGRTKWTPRVIRYADDFVVIHRDLEVIKRVKEIAAEWLKGMGLEMKPSKTRITHTLESIDGPAGFDFLGFNVRQYARGKSRGLRDGTGRRLSFTTSIRPSAESQKRLLQKIRKIVHTGRTWPQEGLIGAINPILRGWGNYYSTVVSKDIFHKLDHLIFWKLWAWACRRHSNKTRGWIARRYWLHGNCGWKFETKEGTALFSLSRIPIVRHVKVKGDASPYNGDAFYWSTRMGKHPDLPKLTAKMIKRQRGHCPECGLYFKTGDRLVEARIKPDSSEGSSVRYVIVHDYCMKHHGRVVCDDNAPFCRGAG